MDFIMEEVPENQMGRLLECLRYAGVITKPTFKIVPGKSSSKTYYTFRVYQPKGVSGKQWAKMNVSRCKSFQINAHEAKSS